MPDGTSSPPAPVPSLDELRGQLHQLIRHACPQLAEAPLLDDREFADLGITSVEVMCIVFEVEEAYRLDITAAGLDDFEKLGDMLNVVHRLLQMRQAQA